MRAGAKHYVFPLSVGAFVIVSSFLYGISLGLERRSGAASAASAGWGDSSGEIELKKLELLPGITPLPMGSDVRINGREAEMISFISERSPQVLTDEQMARWRERGFTVFGKSTARRGVAIALDRDTGERYSFSAWSTPVLFRKLAASGAPVPGAPVQGLMSVVGGSPLEPDRGDEAPGTVPGVPLLPDGRGGAVVSSVDRGARSYSSVYTNPGTVADNIAFYQAELGAAGWNESFAEARGDLDGEAIKEDRSIPHGSALFVRENEEIMLLLTPVSDPQRSERPETVVAVTRGPRSFPR